MMKDTFNQSISRTNFNDMFSHKFFLQRPYYAALLEQTNDRAPQLLRFSGFMLFAHELFGWFANNADLAALKLTCVTLPHFEKNPLSIRLRHHFKLEVSRDKLGQPPLVADLDNFVIEHLPYPQMSQGSFELARVDKLVQQFLSLPAGDESEYSVLVFSLAQRLDLAFQDVSIVHDIGMPATIAE